MFIKLLKKDSFLIKDNLPSKYPTFEALLEQADGNYPNGGKKEGIVIRPTEPVYCEIIDAPWKKFKGYAIGIILTESSVQAPDFSNGDKPLFCYNL